MSWKETYEIVEIWNLFSSKTIMCIYLEDYVSSALDKVNRLARGCNRCLVISGTCVIEIPSIFLKELRT